MIGDVDGEVVAHYDALGGVSKVDVKIAGGDEAVTRCLREAAGALPGFAGPPGQLTCRFEGNVLSRRSSRMRFVGGHAPVP